MNLVQRYIRNFFRNASGATAIEYSLIAGLIALVIIGAVRTTGTRLSARYQAIAGNLT